jgi:glyoxylate carboligase
MAFEVVNIQSPIANSGVYPDDFFTAINTALSAANIPLTVVKGTTGAATNGYHFEDAEENYIADVLGQGSNTRLMITEHSVVPQAITTRGPGYYPTIIYNNKVVAVLDRTVYGTPYTGYFVTRTNAGNVVFCGSTNSNNEPYMYKNPYSITPDAYSSFSVTITPVASQGSYTGFAIPSPGGEFCEYLYYCPFGYTTSDDTKPGILNGSAVYLVGGAWIMKD